MNRSRRRRALTLLEVMFAIGIVITGLLGVAAIIPVAQLLAAKGLRLDHAAVVGRNAFRDFNVRGMGQQKKWAYFSAPNVASAYPPPAATGIESFCIDPRYFQTANRVPGAVFPSVRPAGSPFMQRITFDVDGDNTSGSTTAISLAQAEQLFMTHDDLALELPDDRTIRPYASFGARVNPPTPGSKRQYDGQMSWMATMAPLLDLNGNPSDFYTLSIVVIWQRDASMAAVWENERSVAVSMSAGPPSTIPSGFNGGGGGDLVLTSTVSAEYLELQEDDWVMLSRQVGTFLGSPIYAFRWYRVLRTEQEPVEVTVGNWQRWTTLLGPDWVFLSTFPTYVTIVDGAIAVYEKTVRKEDLQDSNLWRF